MTQRMIPLTNDGRGTRASVREFALLGNGAKWVEVVLIDSFNSVIGRFDIPAEAWQLFSIAAHVLRTHFPTSTTLHMSPTLSMVIDFTWKGHVVLLVEGTRGTEYLTEQYELMTFTDSEWRIFTEEIIPEN